MVEKKIRKTITEQRQKERAEAAEKEIEAEGNGAGEGSIFDATGAEICQDSILPNGQNDVSQPESPEQDVLSPEYLI